MYIDSIIKYSTDDIRAALFWLISGLPCNNKLVEFYKFGDSLSYSSILLFFKLLVIMQKMSPDYSVKKLFTENVEINFTDWTKAITELTGAQLKHDVTKILIPKFNSKLIDLNSLEMEKYNDRY